MRVLLITSRSPVPAWRGNQVRTTEWIAALADRDLVIVCPHSRAPAPESWPVEWMRYRIGAASRIAGFLRAVGDGRPLQEGLYDTGAARRSVAASLERWRPDVVIVQMVRCAWAADLVRRWAPETPMIFDAIDAMGLHFERAGRAAPPPLSVAYRVEARRCRCREHGLAVAATLTVAVSERDLDSLEPPSGRGRVVPVSGREVARPATEAGGPIVLLSGNLGYRPTVQGALWFAREVWPRLRSAVPDARWVLAGARPTAAVRRLERLPGVEVHENVPDMERYLVASRVAIAPMSSGSGVPLKVLEAMAAGLPAVVHPWAADGLAGAARDAVSVAERPAEWRAALETLLVDPEAARGLGQRGRELWQKH
jgi:glycosyltransferase involved in cell wall biosynthesis